MQSLLPLKGEQYRPEYHFRPPRNWINDPNGPMYFNGYYHFFYQYNPNGAVWDAKISWGHSISKDMIHWQHLNDALEPSEPFDLCGCWSGSATINPDDGNPVILYTGLITPTMHQVQNIALPKDPNDPFLRDWVKPSYNPIMEPSSPSNHNSFRDPSTAWKGPDGDWRVIVGSEKDRKGVALLYKSKDLVKHDWVQTQPDQPLHDSGRSCLCLECPDFFPVAIEGSVGLDTSEFGPHVKHVMIGGFYHLDLEGSTSTTSIGYYCVGTYLPGKDVDRYQADDQGWLKLDMGKLAYAAKSFYDGAKKRRVLWTWVNEGHGVGDEIKQKWGWAGTQTVPRKVWLDPANGRKLLQWPIQEVESLRSEKLSDIQNMQIKVGSTIQIARSKASQADVEVVFELSNLDEAEEIEDESSLLLLDSKLMYEKMGASVRGGIGPFGLLVLASSDLEEQTAVYFRVFKLRPNKKYVVLMCIDESKSSLATQVKEPVYGGLLDVDLQHDNCISLRCLIDHSIVESFGGGGKTCITSRVYPKIAAAGDDVHIHVFNNGAANVHVSNLTAWTILDASTGNFSSESLC